MGRDRSLLLTRKFLFKSRQRRFKPRRIGIQIVKLLSLPLSFFLSLLPDMKTPTNDSYDNDSSAISSPTNLGKRKGRPPKQRGQNTTNPASDDINFLDDESDLSFDEYMDTSDNESSIKKQRGRGTPKTKETLPLPVLDEESDMDEAGESKVDKDGHLLEGRQVG